MSELRGRALALVEAARADAPTTADRTRVRAALAARLGAAPLPDAMPTGAPAPGVAVPAGIGAKVLAIGGVIGAFAFVAGVVAGKTSATPVDQARHGVEAQALRQVRAIDRVSLREAVSAAPVSAAPVSVKSDVVTPPNSQTTASPAPSGRVLVPHVVARSPAPPELASATASPDPPATKASSLMEETKLLTEAQTALGSGDARAALAKLDELGARHPDGLLREERLAARILALCAAGRDAEARRDAEIFLAEMRGSIQAGRVRASCAFANKDDRGAP